MIRTKGWEYIKKYYQIKIQKFANDLLLKDEPIEKFEVSRNELKGLRNLLGMIENDIKLLEDDRQKNKSAAPKQG